MRSRTCCLPAFGSPRCRPHCWRWQHRRHDVGFHESSIRGVYTAGTAECLQHKNAEWPVYCHKEHNYSSTERRETKTTILWPHPLPAGGRKTQSIWILFWRISILDISCSIILIFYVQSINYKSNLLWYENQHAMLISSHRDSSCRKNVPFHLIPGCHPMIVGLCTLVWWWLM